MGVTFNTFHIMVYCYEFLLKLHLVIYYATVDAKYKNK